MKFRLTIMNFLQFFIWGSWLISLSGYLVKIGASGSDIASVYSTMGIATLITSTLFGIVADKWVNAERMLGICHIVGAVSLIWASTITDPSMMFYPILLNTLFYMPTLALSNTVSYNSLIKGGFDVVKDFPPIRIWGTIGFIAAMWCVNLFGFKDNYYQFYLAAGAALVLGVYSFTLPACVPVKKQSNGSLLSTLGLDALVLLKNRNMSIFFLFSVLLGAALQITNMYAEPFLNSFEATHPEAFAVKYSVILISISQMSETFCILLIPFFLKKFGIKTVMLFSMIAWALRFGLLGLGSPDGFGVVILTMSMIVYGFAFDFFNISGSLFVEKETDSSMRASAQGLFILATNGFGVLLGSYAAGQVVDYIAGDQRTIEDWRTIWFVFAAYALVLAVIFALTFKYKHKPEENLVVKQ